MKPQADSSRFSRRDFLKLAGSAVFLAAGASLLPQYLRKTLLPIGIADAAEVAPDLYLAGTDGWIYLPPDPPISFYHPDNLAPAPFNTYIFGFRNITGLDANQISQQKNHAQHNAPLFWAKQFDPGNPKDFRVQLTNLGLAQRPDLTDSHTLHWHGFRNVIPFFDGEPTGSVSVPAGRLVKKGSKIRRRSAGWMPWPVPCSACWWPTCATSSTAGSIEGAISTSARPAIGEVMRVKPRLSRACRAERAV